MLAIMKGFETLGTARYGHGEAGMGMFTVPLEKVAYLTRVDVNVAEGKTMDVQLYEFEGATRTASSFLPRRVIWGASQLKGGRLVNLDFRSFIKIKNLVDLCFRAKTVGGGGNGAIEVKCEFYIADQNASGK